MLRYDLIIVGGGMVGAGLAAALQQSNLRVALVDARLPSSNDPRLIALNAGSCQFLANLGLWDKLAEHAAAIHQVHVSYQGHFGSVRLNREEAHLPQLGHVIPAYHIESALNESLEALPNVTSYRPAKLDKIVQEETGATLTITTEAGEKTLHAALVIGADGTESTVRTQLQIKTDMVDYEQSALVTRTLLNRSHQHIAYERFNANGAIAMLPLVGNECATIWTADNQTISHLMSISDQEFLDALQTSFGYRLGRLIGTAKRHVYPLRMVRAEKAIAGSVLLLGNSAHTLSPIAAQGFNLALYEVATLVDAIQAHCLTGAALNSLNLQQVIAKTEKQQSVSIGTSHRLTEFFANRHPLASIAVQLGMVGLDVATPIKKRFITTIMGRAGQVPKLLLNRKDL